MTGLLLEDRHKAAEDQLLVPCIKSGRRKGNLLDLDGLQGLILCDHLYHGGPVFLSNICRLTRLKTANNDLVGPVSQVRGKSVIIWREGGQELQARCQWTKKNVLEQAVGRVS